MEFVGWIGVGGLILWLAWFAGTRARRWWPGLLPLTIPALLGVWAAGAASTEDRSECYEECGYEWLILFAVVSLIGTVAIVLAFSLGRAWARRGR